MSWLWSQTFASQERIAWSWLQNQTYEIISLNGDIKNFNIDKKKIMNSDVDQPVL